MRGRTALLVAAAMAARLAWTVAAAGDELLYYEQGGRVIFTNTPSRKDVKLVPGLRQIRVGLPDRLPPTVFDPFIRAVASDEGLDASLIKAVALVESGFNPRAVSPKGARGIMQLMPATARRYGVRNPHDPYESLRAGARHLRDLLVEFEGNVTLALAAYNAGSGAVRRHGGVPGYRETQDYVRKVTARLGEGSERSRSKPTRVRPGDVVLERGGDGAVQLSN